MSKDYMTGGEARWITISPDKFSIDTSWKNPWAKESYRHPQFAPIDNRGGIALFRKSFTVTELCSARIDATALGVYELWCNGKRVGRDDNGETVYEEFKPGNTNYFKRALYYSYDITSYLTEGENTILAALAPGWYAGRISFDTYPDKKLSFLAAIHLHDKEGSRTIHTDSDWQAYWGSAVRASDIYDGEIFDASFPYFDEMSRNDFPTDLWIPSDIIDRDVFVTPHIGPAVTIRKGLERKPVSLTVTEGTVDNGSDFGKVNTVADLGASDSLTLRRGQTAIVDVGQNMVGWPVFKVKGSKGTAVQIRVAEMLNDSGLLSRGNDNPEGSLYTINYRSAKAKAYYVLSGKEEGELYRPSFTFFGFRYLEFSASEDVEISDITAEVIGSATREIGSILTSHKDVNQLISNILWGQRGNFLSVPTDCPQRDERFGWTGDTQAFCGTAAYNADVCAFFHKWLQDMRDEQTPEGVYPDTVPRNSLIWYGGTAWTDAAIIVPFTMWRMYGDVDIIKEHYASMEHYMEWLSTSGLMGARPHYGDWLAYEETDRALIGVAYYAYDADLMARMSNIIGKKDREEHYRALYDQLCTHFRGLFCDKDGDLKPEHRTQAGYLLSLRYGLLEPQNRPSAIEGLREKIINNNYTLSTGFVGTCILNQTLADIGANDLAYSLLLQTNDPSWLYSVHQGATTIWERWNSYTIANGFGDVSMNSFNHYAYGAVEEWMYRYVAGIDTSDDAPGFAHVILRPMPDTREVIPEGQERITWVKASYDSAHGLIESSWDITDGFVYEASVPVATTLRLPILTESPVFTVNGIEHSFDEYPSDNGTVIIELAPGSYTFIQK